MDRALTLTVEAKVLGQSRPAIAPWELALRARADDDGGVRVRDLLTAVVSAEVAAFRERQDQRRLTRVLLPEEIARGAERGKIDAGGHDDPQPVNTADAIAAALQAFDDQLYYIFVDGQQMQSLDEVAPVREASHIIFVRLVALIGG